MVAPTMGSTAATTAPTTSSGAAMPTAGTAGATTGGQMIAGRTVGGSPDVPDAYTRLPPAFKATSGTPGKGGKVSVFEIAYNPPPPARDQNKYWQHLEKQLGVMWDVTLAPAGDQYTQKISTLTASNDLPDLTYIYLTQAPDQNKVILQGAYTDLTPYLDGDAKKEFPNLALISNEVWERSKFRGKIFGVPKPRFNTSGSINLRRDWAEKLGNPQPKNAEEFFKTMTDMTKMDPDGNGRGDTFGIGSHAGDVFSTTSLRTMFRVPNEWRKGADGSLTHYYETDEYKATVAFQRRMWEAGLFFPDSTTMSPNQGKDNFIAGKYGAFQDSVAALFGPTGLRAKMRGLNMAANPVSFVLPGHDGGKGVAYLESGYFGFVAIPVTKGRDRERVKELLHILDYLAAPFGSEEFLALGGIEGVHFTVQPDGTRITTDQGRAEKGDLVYLMNPAPVFYYPDVPGDAQELQNVVREMAGQGIQNPTLGLYSPTNAAKSSELGQLRTDRLVPIITGREPFATFDTFVRDWRSRGGDMIRKELQDAAKG